MNSNEAQSLPYPADWRILRFEEFCSFISNGFVGTVLPFYSTAETGVCYIQGFNVRPNRINTTKVAYVTKDFDQAHKKTKIRARDLLTVQSGHIGTTAVVPPSLAGANCHAVIISRPNPALVDSDYVAYFLNSEYGERLLKKLYVGSSVQHINTKDLKTLGLPLPSREEQSKIAEILTCWDKAIELVERLIEEKRTLKKSLSQRIFFSKHRPTISADSEWITVELRNLLEVSKDKEPISKTRPLFSLTIEHGVTPKTDRYDREALVKDKVAKLYKVVNPMDIVFNPSNLRWGAIGLCRQETPVLVSPIYEVVRVKDPKSTSTEFLFQLLSSERQINFFATLTEGTLIERMAVKVDTFLDQTVCIPSRREDQDALAAILALADREISSLAQLDIELKQQKRGLMQQLLTGKMRVKV